MRAWPLPILASSFIWSFGCAHKPEVKATAAPPPMAQAVRESRAPDPVPATSTCRSDVDCGDRQLCLHNQCVDISAGLAECLSVRRAEAGGLYFSAVTIEPLAPTATSPRGPALVIA